MILSSSKQLVLLSLSLVLIAAEAQSANVYVNPGNDLNAVLNAAVAGDNIYVAPGIYNPVVLQNKILPNTASRILVKKNGTGDVIIRNAVLTTGNYALKLTNCRYMAFDGISFQGGIETVRLSYAYGLIFKNCNYYGPGQAGITMTNSNYVDFRGGHIYNTGLLVPSYGEGIYIGSGSTADNDAFVWIEGLEINNTGNGEAIDFKPGANRCTARGNNVHDIHPGTSIQHNEGAIVVNGYDFANFVLSSPQNIWVENNTVTTVSGGLYNRGIVFFGSGVKVKNNSVTNCASVGILASNYLNKGYTNYLYGNTTVGNNPNVVINSGIIVLTTNPGTNPYTSQTWY